MRMPKRWADTLVNLALVVLVPCALITVGLRLREARSSHSDLPEAKRLAGWQRLTVAGHREGAANAKMIVVWFSDFQCPFCKQAHRTLQNLLNENSDNLAIIHRHFPLSGHKHARLAAVASVCAARQDKFPQMRDALFDLADSLGAVTVLDVARRAGVPDSASFNRCLTDPIAADIVSRDSLAGASFGLAGTPGIIVNGWAMSGFPGDSVLARLVRGR
jgi:protein-disulfide isomerase